MLVVFMTGGSKERRLEHNIVIYIFFLIYRIKIPSNSEDCPTAESK